jgi:hypothetical protein
LTKRAAMHAWRSPPSRQLRVLAISSR